MTTLPRSALHALEPQGIGTGQAESLLSYFCRLAVSHAVSTADLARFVVQQMEHDIRPDFEWQQRNLSGVGESAKSWSAWLSALTGVGHLDGLTLSRWSAVLPAIGLAPKRAHWCPACLQEDKEAGLAPYFRLAWEIGPVQACYRHKLKLTDTCPHCGQRHVRHQGGVVVPGWCTRCGGFLGEGESAAVAPHELWVARQVGDWVASQSHREDVPEAGGILVMLNTLVLGLDGGKYTNFAKRLGVAKSVVHGWLKKGVLPSLGAYLAIAGHSGLSLDSIMRGDLSDWEPHGPGRQLAMDFDLLIGRKREKPREHDWAVIRRELEKLLKLPEPISVAEAGRRLGIDDRNLYLQANDLARALGERWKNYLVGRKADHRAVAMAHLREALSVAAEAGRPFNLTEVRQLVPAPVLASVEGMFGLIREVREG